MNFFPAIKKFFVTRANRNSLMAGMRLRSTVDNVVISTVRLPIQHGDHWYETAAFLGGESDVLDRYVTEIEAARGHAKYVELAQNHKQRTGKLLK